MFLKKYGWMILLLIAGGFFVGKSLFMSPKFDDGNSAPDFTAVLESGKEFSLSDLKGQYVLLDFWGTWCGPCRADIPKLRALNQKYGGKNFEIVAIAMEREGSEKRWRQGIEKLGLDWEYHIFDPVSNFKLLNAKIGTQLYGVREVPTKYLIDPKGQIIGVNPTFEAVESVLNSQ